MIYSKLRWEICCFLSIIDSLKNSVVNRPQNFFPAKGLQFCKHKIFPQKFIANSLQQFKHACNLTPPILLKPMIHKIF